jgi:hypothetical protein
MSSQKSPPPVIRSSSHASKNGKARMSKQMPDGMKAWIEARRRHHLSHAHVQMARELGMSPKKLSGLDNHRQERWKIPLPAFIEELYEKRFGRERPEIVLSIEERFRQQEKKKAAKREVKLLRREVAAQGGMAREEPIPSEVSGHESGGPTDQDATSVDADS